MPEEIIPEPVSVGRIEEERRLESPDVSPRAFLPTVRHTLRFGNIGAIYVWIAIVIFFTIKAPGTFFTWDTVKTVLNLNAISGLVALSLVVPLCGRAFDLSVGYIVAVTSVLSAALIAQHGYSFVTAIVLCVLVAAAVGAANGVLVVGIGIDSFIATLATGSALSAVVVLISNNVDVTSNRLSLSFAKLSTSNVGGITVPVFIMVIVAVALWWLLEQTVTGRRLYATGFNEEGARLAGVRTRRLRFLGLVTSGVVAGVAGILVTAQDGSGAPSIGPEYLLSSFAAVFLGATQFRNGRFNAQGTIVAILLLGTGTAGLAVIGAQPWVSDMFTAVVLIASLALYQYERRRVASRGAHAS
jgi:ribose transport system permease protein